AYRSALELDPENYVALNNLALELNDRRRFAEAESLALRGIAVVPNAVLYVNATTAQVAQGKLAEAARTVQSLAARAPKSPLTFFLRAGLAEARRDFDSAQVIVQEQAHLAPDLSSQEEAAYGLAFLSLVRGRVAQAEAQFRKAMAIDEQLGQPGSYLKGVVELAMIDVRYRNAPGAALRRLEEGLRRHVLDSIPAEDRPYLALAWLCAEAGRPERGRQLLAEYEATVPEAFRRREPIRHGAAAAVALAEGRVQDAISAYRAWYDQDRCAVCGLFDLARAYERAGERDSALAVYERAVTTPGLTRMFEEATTLGPTYKRLGELYEQRGDTARARDYYGRFVELWKDADAVLQPEVREVRQRVARLTTSRVSPRTSQ
ncbi:MAG TPA: tetratricopeptide repeat protein, partial [Myxococcales bacterium]|nr:tetratricopeptide repeat protein [Myxococcales bacterium]